MARHDEDSQHILPRRRAGERQVARSQFAGLSACKRVATRGVFRPVDLLHLSSGMPPFRGGRLHVTPVNGRAVSNGHDCRCATLTCWQSWPYVCGPRWYLHRCCLCSLETYVIKSCYQSALALRSKRHAAQQPCSWPPFPEIASTPSAESQVGWKTLIHSETRQRWPDARLAI